MILIGKECGKYKDFNYYRLYLASELDEKKGDGMRPLICKCSADVYDMVSVGVDYDANDLYYDRYGKIIGIR